MSKLKKFYEILKAGAKYGKRFIDWCWNNKGTIYRWLERGMSVTWIVDMIRQILGL